MQQNPFQILQNQRIFFTRVVQIDVGVGVLDVDDEAIQDVVHLFDDFRRHVEAGLCHDLPLVSTQGAKLFDELLLQQRLSPTEGHTTTGGEEIQLVNLDLFEERLGGVVAAFVHVPRGLVEAVLAAQGTSVERHQGGDALAVDGEAVTGDSEDFGGGHSR